WLLLPLSVVACVLAAIKKQPWFWVLAAFSIVYYILIGRAEVLFLRYTFPLYIILAAGLGWLMGRAHEKRGRYRYVVGLGILALGISFAASAQMTVWMSGT